MRTAEDARRDPRPGDVFKREVRTREVVGIHDGKLALKEHIGASFRGYVYLTSGAVKDWAATAEVLKVAQP